MESYFIDFFNKKEKKNNPKTSAGLSLNVSFLHIQVILNWDF